MEGKNFEMAEGVPQDKRETVGAGFHFEEIAEIEPAVVSLVEQMKENIDSGKYDTLLSDDVGGRIPTLVFREILRARHPEQRVKVRHIASGRNYVPDEGDKERYRVLQDYLKMATKGTEKALLVTQYIMKGGTIAKLSHALKDAGLDNFDVASVHVAFETEARERIEPELGENNLYTGPYIHAEILERHEHLSGVRKSPHGEYSPFPRRAVDVLPKLGRYPSDTVWDAIFGLQEGEPIHEKMRKENDPVSIEKFRQWSHAPVTEEEKAKIQEDIRFAREDVKLLARRVVENVWGKDSDTV